MNEFMFFIRTTDNPVSKMSPHQQQEHVQKVGAFIENLVSQGKLKEAQPLTMDGVIISGKKDAFVDGPFNESKEVIAGYYHIVAKDIDDAVAIAKSDPRFEDEGWRIEVRPIMKVEGIN